MRRSNLHIHPAVAADAQALSGAPDAERLIGLGFRHWVAGYKSGDIDRWEEAWRLYSHALGPNAARTAVSELSAWVRAVSAAARREITVSATDCAAFCRDECLAVSMIAACQHNTCPAMRACAFALIESSLIDEVVHHAETFALTMRGLDQVLPPGLIVNAAAYASQAHVSARQ
ncbi:MAG: hypothetical protein K2Y42_19435 [Hyphomicrobium sp.]|jgi:hypothetical protein|uniref:hypothetical protein n=1 Tax=Hyphomicrobium sp. TaxID=82 RepID=UPI0025C2B7FF|nr:hypothetical protein [Hyphomicrobium sp.]MBX9864920.1 hypothetical protein [Hyphomicrobium sp.]